MKSTAYMVWHIFKKDVRLLRLFVLANLGIQFVSAGAQYAQDHLLGMGPALDRLCELLHVGTLIASGLLIITAVQIDPVPGAQQDWLVRPIRRRDLLLSKFLFVLFLVQGPIFLTDTLQALANGFPLSQSLIAAFSRNLYLLVGLSIPVLAFASLTRNMPEAMVGGLLAFLGFATLILIFNTPHQLGALRGTGLFWIAESTMFLVALLGSSGVLAMQYFRRKMIPARWTMTGIGLLFLLGYLVPMNFAFAIERRLSPYPGAGINIAPVFEPSLGNFHLPQGVTHKSVAKGGGLVRDEASTVYLPLNITGLSDDMVLNADHAEALLTGTNGNLIFRGAADDLLLRRESPSHSVYFNIGQRQSGFFRDITPEDRPSLKEPVDNNGAFVYQGLTLPRSLYEHIKDQPLRLEIIYSLTLLRGSTYTLPTLNGDLRIPHVGRCKTRMDSDADDIQVHCIQAGLTQACASIHLENSRNGNRNPGAFSCWPNYAPYFGEYYPDAMVRFGASLRFRDVSGLTKYPVDSTQISESQVVAHTYEPQDHFNRRLVIPEIRLSDWESIER